MQRFHYRIGMALLSVGILLLSGCKHKDSPRPAEPIRVEVEVMGADAGAGAASATSYSGTVLSAEESLVGFSVPGNITHIYVKEGQKVAKGQVLARVKSESLNDEREIAVAELEQVRDLYNRLKILHDQNALPEVKWVEVKAKLKQAESAVALADKTVNDASLTAPISGYVAEKLADVGQNVLPAQPVLKIVNINDLQLAISVPEEDINKYKEGTKATVRFDGLDNLTVEGTLAAKNIVADPLTRSYKVKFNISDPQGRILPGMIASVDVPRQGNVFVANEKNAFVVPSQAVLLSFDNKQFVWVVKDGKAQRKFVTANELRPQGVAIDSGLASGDSLIVAGMQKVSVGTSVTPIVH